MAEVDSTWMSANDFALLLALLCNTKRDEMYWDFARERL